MQVAKESVQRSVASIFNELSNIWIANDMKLIFLSAIDVTFLPAFKHDNEALKNAVQLLTEWNHTLELYSKKWKRGSIYLVNTNFFILDQVRRRQQWIAGLTNTQDYGKNGMDWDNVNQACVATRRKWFF
ncbi:hypothetical protein EMCG_06336 [[Emmonsia] crescens]|uniref:Uncharacterized protein n=1 Tax=[Emmonsia] crescens TaxID=73230 RepID=A0A0G2ICK1_9EURO|nr:hypothetical protein EMCG_06336 [Emmonsia crescens UAMH 3008]